ncbi:RNA polymerase II elongation factor Ell isoform X3 [Culex pipiens pallens]|uniref:RNA polymerase II elongation factor Ell isoform X3 n=1 Tax=Culex pipiens pallens TaxID=42434 RepID=UPI0022AAB8B1|nr:RNA polymerase II elongation factor Ell isoform X3 [Culex pipiens pallens]
MAALCAGNYGLTQQHSGSSGAGDNKELIFVKLTDSALRAIEEFQRNQLKLGGSLNPSIQFVNGQGHLSFPSHNGNNVQKFSFSLADIEGGGTLECVQQTTGQPLQNIGHIQHKMRIHANDDVYETTRHRMAAAEETKKDKCTREIKPNQTDIGRKVKLKNPTTRISNIPPSSNSVLSKRDSSNNTYNNHSSSTTNNNHISNNNSSSGAGVINNNSNSSLSVASANNNHNSSSNNNNNHNSNHLLSNGNSHSNHVANNVINHNNNNNNNSSSYNNLSTSPKLAAAAKSNGLQQQHNNHLHHNNNNNHSVNNQSSGVTLQQQHKPGYQPTVHDPPYQQSQQKSENGTARGTNGRTQHGKPEIMKRNIRRKPQNLTPPLSSDGGSSTSGQSPSSAHNGSSPPSGSKRPSIAGDEGGAAGAMPTAKKPRISHYKKDILPDINRRGVTDSRDTSNMNPRSRPHDSNRSSNYYHHHGSNVTPNAQESEDSGVSLSYSLVPNDVAKRIQHSAGDVMVADTLVISDRDNYDDQISAYREETKKVKSLKDDFSDQFTRITTVEQRRKYKTEFDNDFQEYRRLHEIVERVSRKFAQLEEDLQHQRNNERRYKEIQRQIIKEYDESIKDNRFQETKQRFNYLHSKLSHIKHLVHDYDVAITNGLCRPQENY